MNKARISAQQKTDELVPRTKGRQLELQEREYCIVIFSRALTSQYPRAVNDLCCLSSSYTHTKIISKNANLGFVIIKSITSMRRVVFSKSPLVLSIKWMPNSHSSLFILQQRFSFLYAKSKMIVMPGHRVGVREYNFDS